MLILALVLVLVGPVLVNITHTYISNTCDIRRPLLGVSSINVDILLNVPMYILSLSVYIVQRSNAVVFVCSVPLSQNTKWVFFY